MASALDKYTPVGVVSNSTSSNTNTTPSTSGGVSSNNALSKYTPVGKVEASKSTYVSGSNKSSAATTKENISAKADNLKTLNANKQLTEYSDDNDNSFLGKIIDILTPSSKRLYSKNEYIIEDEDAELDSLIGQFRANVRSSTMNLDLDRATSKYLDNPTEENRQYMLQLKEAVYNYNQNNYDALNDDDGSSLNKWLKDLAQQIPQRWQQFTTSLPLIGAEVGVKALKYGGIGAAIGAANPIIPVGDETVLGVGGAIYGAVSSVREAMVAGSGIYSYSTMRGAAFNTLTDAGCDEITARDMATDEAIISSAIEMADTAGDLALVLNGKLNLNIANETFAVLKEFVSNPAVKLALSAGGEFNEEYLQEWVSQANLRRLAKGETDNGVTGLCEEMLSMVGNKTEEEKSQEIEAGKAGARVGLMFGGANTAVSSISTKTMLNHVSEEKVNQQADQIISDMESGDATKAKSKITVQDMQGIANLAEKYGNYKAANIYQDAIDKIEAARVDSYDNADLTEFYDNLSKKISTQEAEKRSDAYTNNKSFLESLTVGDKFKNGKGVTVAEVTFSGKDGLKVKASDGRTYYAVKDRYLDSNIEDIIKGKNTVVKATEDEQRIANSDRIKRARQENLYGSYAFEDADDIIRNDNIKAGTAQESLFAYSQKKESDIVKENKKTIKEMHKVDSEITRLKNKLNSATAEEQKRYISRKIESLENTMEYYKTLKDSQESAIKYASEMQSLYNMSSEDLRDFYNQNKKFLTPSMKRFVRLAIDTQKRTEREEGSSNKFYSKENLSNKYIRTINERINSEIETIRDIKSKQERGIIGKEEAESLIKFHEDNVKILKDSIKERIETKGKDIYEKLKDVHSDKHSAYIGNASDAINYIENIYYKYQTSKAYSFDYSDKEYVLGMINADNKILERYGIKFLVSSLEKNSSGGFNVKIVPLNYNENEFKNETSAKNKVPKNEAERAEQAETEIKEAVQQQEEEKPDEQITEDALNAVQETANKKNEAVKEETVSDEVQSVVEDYNKPIADESEAIADKFKEEATKSSEEPSFHGHTATSDNGKNSFKEYQDKVNKDTMDEVSSSKKMAENYDISKLDKSDSFNPDNYEVLVADSMSDGAVAFYIASKFGIKTNHEIYTIGGYINSSIGTDGNLETKSKTTTAKFLRALDEKIIELQNRLGRSDFEKYKTYDNPLKYGEFRNQYRGIVSQAARADTVICIGVIGDKGQIKGTADYAIETAIRINENHPDNRKNIYVFDENKNAWFEFSYETFNWREISSAPKLAKKTALFGTRKTTEAAKQAVASVFENTYTDSDDVLDKFTNEGTTIQRTDSFGFLEEEESSWKDSDKRIGLESKSPFEAVKKGEKTASTIFDAKIANKLQNSFYTYGQANYTLFGKRGRSIPVDVTGIRKISYRTDIGNIEFWLPDGKTADYFTSDNFDLTEYRRFIIPKIDKLKSENVLFVSKRVFVPKEIVSLNDRVEIKYKSVYDVISRAVNEINTLSENNINAWSKRNGYSPDKGFERIVEDRLKDNSANAWEVTYTVNKENNSDRNYNPYNPMFDISEDRSGKWISAEEIYSDKINLSELSDKQLKSLFWSFLNKLSPNTHGESVLTRIGSLWSGKKLIEGKEVSLSTDTDVVQNTVDTEGNSNFKFNKSRDDEVQESEENEEISKYESIAFGKIVIEADNRHMLDKFDIVIKTKNTPDDFETVDNEEFEVSKGKRKFKVGVTDFDPESGDFVVRLDGEVLNYGSDYEYNNGNIELSYSYIANEDNPAVLSVYSYPTKSSKKINLDLTRTATIELSDYFKPLKPLESDELIFNNNDIVVELNGKKLNYGSDYEYKDGKIIVSQSRYSEAVTPKHKLTISSIDYDSDAQEKIINEEIDSLESKIDSTCKELGIPVDMSEDRKREELRRIYGKDISYSEYVEELDDEDPAESELKKSLEVDRSDSYLYEQDKLDRDFGYFDSKKNRWIPGKIKLNGQAQDFFTHQAFDLINSLCSALQSSRDDYYKSISAPEVEQFTIRKTNDKAKIRTISSTIAELNNSINEVNDRITSITDGLFEMYNSMLDMDNAELSTLEDSKKRLEEKIKQKEAIRNKLLEDRENYQEQVDYYLAKLSEVSARFGKVITTERIDDSELSINKDEIGIDSDENLANIIKNANSLRNAMIGELKKIDKIRNASNELRKEANSYFNSHYVSPSSRTTKTLEGFDLYERITQIISDSERTESRLDKSKIFGLRSIESWKAEQVFGGREARETAIRADRDDTAQSQRYYQSNSERAEEFGRRPSRAQSYDAESVISKRRTDGGLSLFDESGKQTGRIVSSREYTAEIKSVVEDANSIQSIGKIIVISGYITSNGFKYDGGTLTFSDGSSIIIVSQDSTTSVTEIANHEIYHSIENAIKTSGTDPYSSIDSYGADKTDYIHSVVKYVLGDDYELAYDSIDATGAYLSDYYSYYKDMDNAHYYQEHGNKETLDSEIIANLIAGSDNYGFNFGDSKYQDRLVRTGFYTIYSDLVANKNNSLASIIDSSVKKSEMSAESLKTKQGEDTYRSLAKEEEHKSGVTGVKFAARNDTSDIQPSLKQEAIDTKYNETMVSLADKLNKFFTEEVKGHSASDVANYLQNNYKKPECNGYKHQVILKDFFTRILNNKYYINIALTDRDEGGMWFDVKERTTGKEVFPPWNPTHYIKATEISNPAAVQNLVNQILKGIDNYEQGKSNEYKDITGSTSQIDETEESFTNYTDEDIPAEQIINEAFDEQFILDEMSRERDETDNTPANETVNNNQQKETKQQKTVQSKYVRPEPKAGEENLGQGTTSHTSRDTDTVKDNPFAEDHRHKNGLIKQIRKNHARLYYMIKSPDYGNHIFAGDIKAITEFLKKTEKLFLGHKGITEAGYSEDDIALFNKLLNDKVLEDIGLYDEDLAESLDKLSKKVAGKSLKDMTEGEVSEIAHAFNSIITIETNKNIVEINGKKASREEVGKAIYNDIMDSKGTPVRGIKNKADIFLMSQLRPKSFLDYISGYKKDSMLSKYYDRLNRAEIAKLNMINDGMSKFSYLLSDKDEYSKFNSEMFDIGLVDENGQAVKINMAFALWLKRNIRSKDNLNHLVLGGFVMPDIGKYNLGKEENGYRDRQVVLGIGSQVKDIENAIKKAKDSDDTDTVIQLIKEKRRIVEEKRDEYFRMAALIDKKLELNSYANSWDETVADFYENWARDIVNEASINRFGYEKALVDNYIQITVDPTIKPPTGQKGGGNSNYDTNSINRNIIYSRKENSGNRLLAMSIEDAATSYLESVASFANTDEVVNDLKISMTAKANENGDSAISALKVKYGDRVVTIFNNILNDLTGMKRDSTAEWFKPIRLNMQRAILGLNPRVMMAQTPSYVTALAELDSASLKKAMLNLGKNEEILHFKQFGQNVDNAILLSIRSSGIKRGFAETADIAYSNKSKSVSKVATLLDKTTAGISFFDYNTVKTLRYATEYWVQSHLGLKPGDPGYYKAVYDKYYAVIQNTQPNFSVMQRSDILRSPNELTRTLTMFMTQRNQNFNILFDSIARLQKYKSDYKNNRNGVSKADLIAAQDGASRSISGVITSTAMLVTFQMLADMMLHKMDSYRDDDDELTKESVCESLANAFFESMASNVVFGDTVYEIIHSAITGDDYYGLQVNSVDTVNDFISYSLKLTKAVQKLRDAKESGDEDSIESAQKSLTNASKNAAVYMSQMFGIPLNNAIKIVNGHKYHVEDILNGEFLSFEAGVERTQKQNKNILADSFLKGGGKRADRAVAAIGEDKLKDAVKYIARTNLENGTYTVGDAARILAQYVPDEENADETIVEYAMKDKYGFSYDDTKEKYINGEITSNDVRDIYENYGGKTEESTETTIKKWDFESEYGVSWDEMRDLYRGEVSGYKELTESDAIEWRMAIEGSSQSTAEAWVKAQNIYLETGCEYVNSGSTSYYDAYATKEHLGTNSMYDKYIDQFKDKRDFGNLFNDLNIASEVGYASNEKLTYKYQSETVEISGRQLGVILILNDYIDRGIISSNLARNIWVDYFGYSTWSSGAIKHLH